MVLHRSGTGSGWPAARHRRPYRWDDPAKISGAAHHLFPTTEAGGPWLLDKADDSPGRLLPGGGITRRHVSWQVVLYVCTSLRPRTTVRPAAIPKTQHFGPTDELMQAGHRAFPAADNVRQTRHGMQAE